MDLLTQLDQWTEFFSRMKEPRDLEEAKVIIEKLKNIIIGYGLHEIASKPIKQDKI